MKNFQKTSKVGEPGYKNMDCWLVKNLSYPPYKRCQYCRQKFRQCLFLHYQVISSVLIILFFALFFLIEKGISILVVIAIFTLVIVYGYFFNKSTGKIVEANFAQAKAKDALEELTENLKQRVDEQTKEIKEKNKYLEELLNMKTDFLRVVNHQLNTPMSIMNGAFAMMGDKLYDVKKGLYVLKAAFERTNQTISDFWDAYELEGEKMKMEPGKADLKEIIERLVEEKQKLQLAQERKLKIEIKQPKFDIPIVWCDPKKIAHVISNLLDNAVFYTEKGGVTVSYDTFARQLKVNIKDTGVGISPEDKKKLFQKFSRGQGATSLHPDGSGLGLYIAKKIVEGNDGELSYESEGIGQGTTFSFSLPIYRNQEKTMKKPGEDSIGQRKKIEIFNANI